MTLKEIKQTVINICKTQPNVHTTAVGSIYDAFNATASVEYAGQVLTEREHRIDLDEDVVVYRFYLFWADRCLEDSSNVDEKKSEGMTTLLNELKLLQNKGLTIEDEPTVNTFEERFASLCAGAYLTFSVTVPISDCADYY